MSSGSEEAGRSGTGRHGPVGALGTSCRGPRVVARTIRSGAFAMLLLGASPLRACPLCESETGERVRAGLFGADFGSNLAVTLLPFPVLLGIVALIHFGPPRA